MGRTSSGRTRRNKLLAAAIASAAITQLTPLGSPRADAGLMIDLRVAGVNGVPVVGNRKSVSLNVGDTLSINVVARVSGTNGVQSVGNFDGSTAPTDTRNDDTIKLVEGGFSSVGGLKGDFLGDPTVQPYQHSNQVSPWNAGGSTNGIAQDFDSDGDLDLGAIGTDSSNMWFARGADQYIPTVSNTTPNTTRFGVTIRNVSGAGSPFFQDVGGQSTGVPDTNIINANTAETLLGELSWVFTGGSGSVSINFVPPSNTSFALWTEDGITTGKTPANSPFTVGTPVTIPEVAPHNLVWNPAGAGGSTVWNTTQTNWLESGSPTHFTDFDDVNFTNSGVGAVNINPAGVSISSMTLSHTSGTYTFSGGPIKGSGAVSITAAGTTVFTTTNTYSGGTTISGSGTLVVDGGDDRLGAPTGSVILNNGILKTQSTGIVSSRSFLITGGGGVFDTNGLTSTLSGVISGTANFTKRGVGSLILTASNTNTGTTTIEAGTLQVGNAGTSGSIAGNVIDNANLTFSRSDDLTFAGNISGSGVLTKLATGTLTLTGSTALTAPVSVNAGTLQIGNDGTVGSVAGQIALSPLTNVTFNRSDSPTYGGNISGAGSLTKLGGGVLTLTGTNTYTGGTTIAAGVIQVGNGGTTGSITGNVSNNGGIVFSRSDDLTYAGVISGTGALTQNLSGRLVLTGNNTYSGGTTILDGTLQIGDGGTTGSITGGVYDGSILIFNRSDNITFGGAIIAGGEVVQSGTGELNLTGSNTHGSTTVLSGSLRVATNANLGGNNASLDMRGGTALKLDASISTSRTVFLGDGLGTVTIDPGGQALSFTGTGGTGINGPIVLANGTLNFNRSGGLIGVGPGSSITVSPGATLNLSGAPVFFDGVDRVNVINNSTASFNVTGGLHDVGQVSGVGNTSVSSGATLTATHIRQGVLTLNGIAAIRPNQTASGVSRLNTLNIGASGKLDVGDNKLIVNSGPLGTWNGSAYDGITALIASGRNGNAQPLWDGTSGIITTQSNVFNSNLTSIGVARASDIRPNTVSETTVWAGQTISGSDVLVMYTYGGDATLDGKINIDDYLHIGIGRGASLSGWSNGDFNYDGKVNIDDFIIIDNNIANQNGYIFPTGSGIDGMSASAGVTAVPEPAGVSLLGLGLSLVARRRRKI